jgi:fructokinase
MIVVAGESLVDVVIDTDGDVTEVIGGAPLNTAVALGRLDTPAILITQTGSDERAGLVVSHVTASGTEIVSAPTRSGRTATATARIGADGDAAYDFDVEWTLPDQELPQCDALHVGGLGTVLEPGRNSVLDLVDQAYARDVAVTFDPNVRPAFVEDRAQLWRDIESLAQRCRLVKLSDVDAALLHPGADPGDIARSLLSAERTELVVLTTGARGATAYVEGNHLSVPAAEVDVVDTVGAGDAFMAGLLTILLESDALGPYGAGFPRDEQSLRRLLLGAVEVASFTCGRRGPQAPTRAELRPGWPD